MDAATVAAAYARALTAQLGPGETVTLVRRGDAGVYQVKARVTDFIPADLAGAVQQGRRNAIILAADVVASGFPLPFKVNMDQIVWGSLPTTNTVSKIDAATRRVAGVLVAYELDLEGA